jgi:hypothetical protein
MSFLLSFAVGVVASSSCSRYQVLEKRQNCRRPAGGVSLFAKSARLDERGGSQSLSRAALNMFSCDATCRAYVCIAVHLRSYADSPFNTLLWWSASGSSELESLPPSPRRMRCAGHDTHGAMMYRWTRRRDGSIGFVTANPTRSAQITTGTARPSCTSRPLPSFFLGIITNMLHIHQS